MTYHTEHPDDNNDLSALILRQCAQLLEHDTYLSAYLMYRSTYLPRSTVQALHCTVQAPRESNRPFSEPLTH